MTSQVVKVRRETIAACMTCPLCNKLLKEATTISLCLHTSGFPLLCASMIPIFMYFLYVISQFIRNLGFMNWV
ncbi:E3 ubiquitin protein ligase DRIP2 [Vitis vinifera]|uniref:E3 ubiquitin protein ligase DRIP2 n=1 Tax=Vitis vinifera TaxID=29760 RepID=A0A438IH62_VITVI|nr:E3 ubiquitin protein ligase DRIP2 [Vitis vinifera]